MAFDVKKEVLYQQIRKKYNINTMHKTNKNAQNSFRRNAKID